MLNKLTWKKLLKFLLEQREHGDLPENCDVMLHNIDTGDEYPCDVMEVDGKLVLAINWETLKD